ncbi:MULTISPECIES: ATP-binding cassette domain-containing protein, partial [unclassified Treponema]
MNILSISNLAKFGRESPLFTGVTFGLNEGEKAAIIGRNGTGKSTLLSTIAGVLEPDEGTVVINKESGASFLSQNPQFDANNTIQQHIFKSNSPKLSKIREYEELCLLMEKGFNKEQQNRFDNLTLEMDKGSLWNYESQVRSILSTLGIKDMTRKMGTLSGGMLKKVALAQVLVEDTKLLLL